MKKYFLISFVILSAFLVNACSSPKTAAEASAPTDEKAKEERSKDEVVLSPEQEAAAKIDTQRVAMSAQPDLLRVTGKIALAEDYTWRVGVRTLGSVVAVYSNVGDFVHKGQIMARYHADEVRDSRAQYRTALSELDRAKMAEAQARRNRDRAQKLLDLKAGSRAQVEIAEEGLVNAEAAVRKAEIEVDRGKDLLEDDLRVPANPPPNRTDETEDDVPIIAPHDGFILEKNVTPGKTVELSAVTFVLGDISKVWMLASVHQEDLGKLRVGQSAVVALAGMADTRFPGKVTNLGQAFDPATRVMQVRIDVANPGNRLRPEMLAEAEIPVGAGAPAITVSPDAIQQVNAANVVFVRTGERRYSVRPVQIGESTDGKTPVQQGLQAGDEVVTRGSFILKSQLLKSTLESE